MPHPLLVYGLSPIYSTTPFAEASHNVFFYIREQRLAYHELPAMVKPYALTLCQDLPAYSNTFFDCLKIRFATNSINYGSYRGNVGRQIP